MIKRFECDKGSRIIIDNETKLHYIMTLDWECSLVTKLLNHFSDENEQLKKDLIDHSALILMLEDYQALKIEEILWNLTGAKSEEEFNELYEPYLEKAKRGWG